MFRTLSILSVLAAAPLAAQGGGAAAAPAAPQTPACDVEQMQPTQLALASIGRSKVMNAKTPDDATKAVKDGMNKLFDKATAQNALGRDYLLAQYYLMAIEYGGEVQTRGNLGIPGDKNATVDLVVAADSLLTPIEASHAACKAEITQWREFKPFANRVASAYKALGAKQLDSAERSAKRAMILSKEAPQSYDVLWRLSNEKGDQAGVLANLPKAIDKLAGDTSNAKVRANLMFTLGRLQQEWADKSQEPQKSQLYKDGANTFLSVVKEYPSSKEAPFALQGIEIAKAMAKDSATALQALSVMKSQSGKYSDMALGRAGVMATNLGHMADAGALFEAAVKANPFSRDYLYNHAYLLYEQKKSRDAITALTQLVSIDPNNPDDVQLLALAYKGLADSTKDAATKKVLNDSATAWYNKADAAPLKLIYTGFDRSDEATQLQGEIENHGKAAATYSVNFEFVDKAGTVIDKKSVSVGPVAPNASGKFDVSLEKGGVAGVRYAPITP